MTVVDLTTTPAPEPAGLLDGLPRRVGLTLAELRHAARLAGGAPLPFDDAATAGGVAPGGRPADRLADRLGEEATGAAGPAYDRIVAGLPDPASSLGRRGLAQGTALDAGLAGALGLLATPRLAVDLDLATPTGRVRSWHRQRGPAVATLSTADGVLFEVAWCHASQWTDELARVATVPELPTGPEEPDERARRTVLLPFELADAATEAQTAGRHDVLPALLDQAGPVTDVQGRALERAEALAALSGLAAATHGRLRALATDVTRTDALPVATVAWLLGDRGWLALEPASGATATLRLAPVRPVDLGGALAPALAAVTSAGAAS
ncbi:hypothetical protein [Nocardioides sp.]|uniref:hypothetical protein n=1 Tax=Nocardioides sp. TaxID=35761 RepID=UPI003527ACD5